MKPIRIFRHLVCQHPGYLGEYLQAHSIPWEMVCVDDENPIPQQTEDLSGLVFMGAGVSVNDRLSWIEGELKLIRKAIDIDLPIMGVCFGAQLISRALGGEISRGKGMEIGWRPVYMQVTNERDNWLKGIPLEFTAFHWHADTYTLPRQSLHLMKSDCFDQQGFIMGNHLGMQFHLEMTREMVENWIERYGSDLLLDSVCSQSAGAILTCIDQRIAELHKISDMIYGKWVERVVARQDK
jgi:GMP synthase-like glutamine amidotransferase